MTRTFAEQVLSSSKMQASLKKQIIEVVGDTARSVQEQAVVSDEIARNLDAVQKIAQEVLGGSEEAVVQGEQLRLRWRSSWSSWCAASASRTAAATARMRRR